MAKSYLYTKNVLAMQTLVQAVQKKKGQVNKKKVKTFSREGRRCVVPMSQKDGWVVDDKEDMFPCSEKPKPL